MLVLLTVPQPTVQWLHYATELNPSVAYPMGWHLEVGSFATRTQLCAVLEPDDSRLLVTRVTLLWC